MSAFEEEYVQTHVPMVTPATFKGIEKFVSSKVVGTAGPAPFYRVAELHVLKVPAQALHARRSRRRARLK